MNHLYKVRYELLPTKKLFEDHDNLPKDATYPITCSAKKGLEGTLRLAERLASEGYAVVPHIPARLLIDKEHLKEVLQTLEEAQISDIFVPGGDMKTPLGEFHSSYEVLKLIQEMGYDSFQIGVAGYPEGHNDISSDTLKAELEKKSKIASYIVTQMCFSSNSILEWASSVREAYPHLRIYAGIPGVVDFTKLTRIAFEIGVGQSLKFAIKNKSFLKKMHSNTSDLMGKILEELSVKESEHQNPISGFHIYTFNKVSQTHEQICKYSNRHPIADTY